MPWVVERINGEGRPENPPAFWTGQHRQCGGLPICDIDASKALVWDDAGEAVDAVGTLAEQHWPKYRIREAPKEALRAREARKAK